MHSWLWRVYIYSTCSHDLLPFKFVGCVCRAIVGKASGAKREKISPRFSEKKIVKKSENENSRWKSCVYVEKDDDGLTLMERGGSGAAFHSPTFI